MSQIPAQPSMQLAEILSDLVSLRICDPSAALALVTATPKPKTTDSSQPQEPGTQQDQEQDLELRRAQELVELHYSVREAHKKGELALRLKEARNAVRRAVGGG